MPIHQNKSSGGGSGGISRVVQDVTIAPSITLDANVADIFVITPTQNVLITNILNTSRAQDGFIWIKQGAGAPYTVTFSSQFVQVDGNVSAINTLEENSEMLILWNVLDDGNIALRSYITQSEISVGLVSKFLKTSNRVEIASSGLYSATDFQLSAKVNIDDITADQELLGSRSSATSQNSFSVFWNSATSQVEAEIGNTAGTGSGAALTLAATIADGVDFHLQVTYDGTNFALSVDDDLTSTAYTSDMFLPSQPVTVGAIDTATGIGFDGEIWDLTINGNTWDDETWAHNGNSFFDGTIVGTLMDEAKTLYSAVPFCDADSYISFPSAGLWTTTSLRCSGKFYVESVPAETKGLVCCALNGSNNITFRLTVLSNGSIQYAIGNSSGFNIGGNAAVTSSQYLFGQDGTFEFTFESDGITAIMELTVNGVTVSRDTSANILSLFPPTAPVLIGRPTSNLITSNALEGAVWELEIGDASWNSETWVHSKGTNNGTLEGNQYRKVLRQ